MPKVIFHTEFFDNNRRYRTGVEYDIREGVVLPTTGIDILEEEDLPVRRRVSPKE
mgnify:CR=1 FL=1|jgi:hypothetical protein